MAIQVVGFHIWYKIQLTIDVIKNIRIHAKYHQIGYVDRAVVGSFGGNANVEDSDCTVSIA
jgi:hypothetical protein